MRRILVNPEELRATANTMRNAGIAVLDIGRRLGLAAGRLEWEAVSRAGVEGRVREAECMAVNLGNGADALAVFLLRTAERFEEADQQGVAQLSTSTSLMQEILHNYLQYGHWLGVAGFPVAVVEALISQGLLFAPGAGSLPYFSPLGVVEELLRRWVGPLTVSRVPPEQLKDYFTLGRFLVGGAAVTLFEIKTGIPGLTLDRLESDGRHHSASAIQYQKRAQRGPVAETSTWTVGKADAEASLFESNAQFSLVEKKHEAAAGNDTVRVSIEDHLRLGTAGASYDINPWDGGVEAKAYAAVLEKGAAVGLEIFGLDIKVGVKVCAACVGGAVKLGRKGEVKLAEAVGLGLTWDIDPTPKG